MCLGIWVYSRLKPRQPMRDWLTLYCYTVLMATTIEDEWVSKHLDFKIWDVGGTDRIHDVCLKMVNLLKFEFIGSN